MIPGSSLSRERLFAGNSWKTLTLVMDSRSALVLTAAGAFA